MADVAEGVVTVVVANEQTDLAVDVDRWASLAARAVEAEGAEGELTLTFVTSDEIAELNAEHMGVDGPTDVLSFPLDTDNTPVPGMPILLGDIVVCPGVAEQNAPEHAGTLDDELALLVVHGVLHVLGHDHAEPAEAAVMRQRELALLEALHWGAAAPDGFRQLHSDDH